MEKYGFVYIWYDRKHKRYYIGSHWGTKDDGYICSSHQMRKAYKRRPTDFKRKILEVIEDRSTLYDVESKWLKLAESKKNRYYNRNFNANHWSAYPKNIKTLPQKISYKTKEAMQRPEVRAKYEEGLKKRDNKGSDPKVIEKRKKTMIQTMDKKFTPNSSIIEQIQKDLDSNMSLKEAGVKYGVGFNRMKKLVKEKVLIYDMSQCYVKGSKKMWENRTEEQKQEISKKISAANKKNKRKNITCPHCNKTGNPIVMPRWHFDNCKLKTV